MPELPLLELVARGSIMYLGLFCLLRLVLRRQAGSVGMTDLVVIVLIADAAQNAMAAEYHSIADGFVLVTTLVFWNYILEWLGYRFPMVERFIHPPPLPLIKKGRMLRQNMKCELISEEDLMSWLREKGVEDIKEVKVAYIEGNGKISIICDKPRH